ncbi:unnamed protein product, partial [Acanthoscelides obtectus]
TYIRKKENLKPLTEYVLIQAKELREKGLSFREIGRALGYDESTTRKRIKAGSGVNSLGRFRKVFTAVQEQQMVNHCKALDLRFYGLTLKSLRFLAYQFAHRNGIPHPFNNETRLAGRDWTRQFMKRNRLSLRTPRKTSVARTMGFNQQQLSQYFENLKYVLEKYKFPANRIYNMDESGFQTVPSKLPKHVAPTGKREVAKNVAAEQGKTVTVACSMSATGHYVPPFFIFARKRLNSLLIKDAPSGSALGVTDSGYMNSLRFVDYLEHFRKYTNPTFDSPILLILDNHISHTSLQAITYAKNNNIHLLSLPPHSSHRTQPLDRSFFRPLKENKPEGDNEGGNVAEGIGEEGTSREGSSGESNRGEINSGNGNSGAIMLESNEKKNNVPDNSLILSEASCSSHCEGSVVLPSDIIPLPIISKKRKRTRKGLKSTLLTSTPNKEELENIEQEKKRKMEEKERKAKIKMDKKVKRNVFKEKQNLTRKNSETSSESESGLSLHDSSSDLNLSTSDDETVREFTPGQFVVVKVYGKNKKSFRHYVMRIIEVMEDGCSGRYFKKASDTQRFIETTEEFFVNKCDIGCLASLMQKNEIPPNGKQQQCNSQKTTLNFYSKFYDLKSSYRCLEDSSLSKDSHPFSAVHPIRPENRASTKLATSKTKHLLLVKCLHHLE